MANYYTLLTPAGLAKVTNAQLTNEKIEITQVAVGDANGTGYKPSGAETALKREVWRGGISSIEVDAQNPNWIVVEAIVPSSVGGFTMREVALFDTAGDMIAIGNYPDTYKPVANDGSTMDLALRTIIEVNNATSVTLKVDTNVIVASRAYVDTKVAGAIGGIGTDLTALDERVTTHLADDARHIEAEERVAWNGKIDSSEKGQPNGVAALDADGKVTGVKYGAYELVSDTTLSASAAQVNFDVTGFRLVKILFRIKAEKNNAAQNNMQLRFNDDDADNYYNYTQHGNYTSHFYDAAGVTSYAIMRNAIPYYSGGGYGFGEIDIQCTSELVGSYNEGRIMQTSYTTSGKVSSTALEVSKIERTLSSTYWKKSENINKISITTLSDLIGKDTNFIVLGVK